SLVIAMIYFFLPETSQHMHSDKLKFNKISKGYLEILQNKTFLSYTLAGSIAMSVLFAYISSASFIFLTYFKLDKTTFSILFAINASGLITGSYVNGLLTKYISFIQISRITSVILSIISAIVLAVVYLNPELPYQWAVVGLFLILFSIGFINPNATAASLAPFTKNAGTASALGGAIRMGVGAMVAAAIGIFQGNTPMTMFTTIFVLVIFSTILLWFSPKVLK